MMCDGYDNRFGIGNDWYEVYVISSMYYRGRGVKSYGPDPDTYDYSSFGAAMGAAYAEAYAEFMSSGLRRVSNKSMDKIFKFNASHICDDDPSDGSASDGSASVRFAFSTPLKYKIRIRPRYLYLLDRFDGFEYEYNSYARISGNTNDYSFDNFGLPYEWNHIYPLKNDVLLDAGTWTNAYVTNIVEYYGRQFPATFTPSSMIALGENQNTNKEVRLPRTDFFHYLRLNKKKGADRL
jgi:hypothetical protein